MKNKPLLLISLWLACILGAYGQTSVRAYFEPQSIARGEETTYCIAIEGKTSGQIEGQVPAPDGLTMQYSGQRTAMQFINGESSSQRIHTFTARPSDKGLYSVPEYTVKIDGKEYPVNATTLNVAEGIAPILFFIEKPPAPLYVGQTAPLKIKLLFLSKVGLRNLSPLTQSGEAFALPDGEQKYEQTIETFDNTQYNAIVWPMSVTALKSGAQSLSFNVRAVVADTSQRHTDPFFGNMAGIFSDSFSQRTIDLKTDALALDVLPLPTEGKPLNFSGAIGTFTFTAAALNPPRAQVGEPVSVRLYLNGEGNFERISAPALDLGEGWKVYTPKQTFTPRSANEPQAGELLFEYVVIPLKEGQQRFPGVPFNYFDPRTGKYKTIHSPAVDTLVLPASAQSSPPPAVAPKTETAPARPEDKGPQLAPQKDDEGAEAKPFYTQAWFWASQLLLVALLAGVVFRLGVLKERRNNPEIMRQKRYAAQRREFLSQAESAAQRDDAAAFFPAVQNTLRYAVARHHDNPGALAREELCALLRERAADTETLDTLSRLWEMGDALKFGAVKPVPLGQTLEQLKDLLNKINGLF